MSDCRLGVSPVNYPDPDPFNNFDNFKRRLEKNSFEILPGSGIEMRGCPLAPTLLTFQGATKS